MVVAGAEVFGHVVDFYPLVVAQEVGVDPKIVGLVVLVVLAVPAFVEGDPAVVAEDLLVVHAVVDGVVLVADRAELNAVVDFKWLNFDFGHHLVNQCHALSVVDHVLVAVDAVAFVGVVLQVNRVEAFRARGRPLLATMYHFVTVRTANLDTKEEEG